MEEKKNELYEDVKANRNVKVRDMAMLWGVSESMIKRIRRRIREEG